MTWLDKLHDLDLVVYAKDDAEIVGWKFQLASYTRRGYTVRPITPDEKAGYEAAINSFGEGVRQDAEKWGLT